MSSILDIVNPWRSRMQPASFRGATFFTEVSARASGRRTVTHEYPKKNKPYTEDMGRSARRFSLRGYCIGPNYLLMRDALIEALEADGPGMLRVQWPVRGQDMKVMSGSYSVNETRERGGMCTFEMEFTEAGTPGFGVIAQSTSGQVSSSSSNVQDRASEVERVSI